MKVRLEALAVAGLVALIAAIYLQTISFQFLTVDDPAYVLDNPHVRTGLAPENVEWAFTTSTLGHWHPLTFLSYMIDVSLFGLNPAGLHFTNFLIHVANTLLLLSLFHRMTGAFWRSALVAALFGVHPLHVESVAWIAERKDVLSTFWALVALHGYVTFAKNRKPWAYGWTLAAFACALMSKAIVVTLPCVMLLLDFWPMGRLTISRDRDRRLPLREWGIIVTEKLPFFGLSAIASYMTVWASMNDHAVRDLNALSLGYRAANAVVSYGAYLGKTVWPTRLSAFYPHLGDELGNNRIALAILLLMALTALAVFAAKRRPYGIVGWLWFIGMIVPVSGLFQVGDQAMADRYTYLALTGVFVWAAWLLPDLRALTVSYRAAFSAMIVVLLLVLSGVAWKQTSRWHDTIRLYEYSLQVSPDNEFTRQVLGHALLLEGRAEEAAVHYRAALEMDPAHVEWINMLGYAYLELGKTDESEALFLKALAINPHHADALNSLGILSLEREEFGKAQAYFSKVVDLRPNYEGPLVNLGIAFAFDGAYREAEPHFRRALEIDPESLRAHINLGTMRIAQGQFASAREHFEFVLSRDSDNTVAQEKIVEIEEKLDPNQKPDTTTVQTTSVR